MMSTTQDFLSSKSWCHKMEEIVFKKADVDGDGYISPEDSFSDYAQKQGVDKTVSRHTRLL